MEQMLNDWQDIRPGNNDLYPVLPSRIAPRDPELVQTLPRYTLSDVDAGAWPWINTRILADLSLLLSLSLSVQTVPCK